MNSQEEQVPVPTTEILLPESSKLLQDISALYLNPKFSDITLVIEDQKLSAHKAILAARSEYFAGLLFETTQKQITIENASIEPFRMLLEYVYTECVTIPDANVQLLLKLLDLAHRYQLKDLETVVTNKFPSIINLENVANILNEATACKLTELADICFRFLDRHASKFLKSDQFEKHSREMLLEILGRNTFWAPEIEIFEATAKWCRVNGDDSVMKCVKFSLMTINEIVSVVWPSNQIKEDILLNAIAEIAGVKDLEDPQSIRALLDCNVARPECGTEVVSNRCLLRDNNVADDDAFEKKDITIRLGAISCINNIKMLLCFKNDDNKEDYSYYIEVSLNRKKWKTIVDYSQYVCRSYQDLYFEREVVRYVRIVGTHSNTRNIMDIVFFEAYCTSSIPEIMNGILRPSTNVATLDAGAIVQGTTPEILDGNFTDYTPTIGYSYQELGKPIIIQLAQPYLISNMKLLLWDQDNRHYKFYIKTSLDNMSWDMIVDKRNEKCKSWQILNFEERPVIYIKIIGTHNSANDYLHCVHLECPVADSEK